MNLKLRINKILESGLWWQILLFGVINVAVLAICLILYFIIGKTGDIGVWDSIRLFIDSNSILDDRDPSDSGNVVLLILECAGTILFSGLIVSIITNVISQKVDLIKDGHVHYKLKNHMVIIGYDEIVPSIISEILLKEPGCKILLQTGDSMEAVRCSLRTKISESGLKNVILVHAPRQSSEELKLLYTPDVRMVFIVGDRAQSDHDAENMHTFEGLVAIHREQNVQTHIPLRIWFENEASYAALQLNDVSNEWKQYFDFRPYNFYKRWANRLLGKSSYGKGDSAIVYPELDHSGIAANSSKHVHLIIIGMNRMGTALAKEAAHLLHFPNFDEKTGQNRTRITFIDDNADREMKFFMGRLPGYFSIASPVYISETETITPPNKAEFLDIQFEFIKGRVESDFVRNWLREQLNDKDALISIAICINNPSQSFGMAMYLPDEVYTRGRNDVKNPWKVQDESQIVNVFVRQETSGTLIKSFADSAKSDSAKSKRYANLYPFGMIDNSFSLNYHSNCLAMAFSYVYDYYFRYNHTLPTSLPAIEDLNEMWKTLSTSDQWSNLYLADSIEYKLRSIGYNKTTIQYASLSNDQIENLARTEHSRWNMEKLLLGYRAWTPEEEALSRSMNKEDQKKFNTNMKKNMFAHPLIKPYNELSDDNKQLDRNIIEELPTIIRALSYIEE